MKKSLLETYEFFKADYKSFPFRFITEAVCWVEVVINTILITIYVPNVHWLICYPIWIVACMAGTWTAYTRKSSIGMVSCILYAIIDAVGLYRYLAVTGF